MSTVCYAGFSSCSIVILLHLIYQIISQLQSSIVASLLDVRLKEFHEWSILQIIAIFRKFSPFKNPLDFTFQKKAHTKEHNWGNCKMRPSVRCNHYQYKYERNLTLDLFFSTKNPFLTKAATQNFHFVWDPTKGTKKLKAT